MLRRLHVKNYVLIDSLDIEFPEGLVIITGQTGAGKSILLGSVALVLGAKADVRMVGESAYNCVVEAEFGIPSSDSAVRRILEDNDVDWDGGHLILRRVVSRTGRSRAFANDCPVSVGVLSALSSQLVDIHSQHQTLLLSDRQFQLAVLDHFAGAGELAEKCSAAWRRYTSLKTELEQLDARIARIEGERDYDEARYSQLESASLKEGELESLEAEQRQLANAEEIKTALTAVESMFAGEDESDGRLSADAMLRDGERRLGRIAHYIPSVSTLADRLVSVRLELEDILSEISALNAGTELSQERLGEVEARLSLLYGLMQKFSCRDVQGLIRERENLKETLHDSSALQERRHELGAGLRDAEKELDEAAEALHARRAEAAPALAAAICDSIRYLELPYAVFDVELHDVPVSSAGKDGVRFLFSSTGRNPVELSQCASGGEMSRIMLCMKDMMARYTHMPTMVFDEIDTGVSGSVADRMGSMICRMGDNMQVFAITHLPQVAAKGKAHYLVSRDTDPVTGKTSTGIRKLTVEERIMEVARMLSGTEVTPAAMENARSLLLA